MNIDIIIFLLTINIISFFLCVFDKYLAIKKKYRISEKILLGSCLIGGVFGFFIASRIIRHKTKDKIFKIFFYPILFLWIIILIYLNLC
ncbi:MAG: DUF1294 domain-containing protein [Bacilli bacterium]|nr:DUF1294 domain-containing protein [Bacilli bacterium]